MGSSVVEFLAISNGRKKCTETGRDGGRRTIEAMQIQSTGGGRRNWNALKLGCETTHVANVVREAASGLGLRWRLARGVDPNRIDRARRPAVIRETIRDATDPSARTSGAAATARSAQSAVATNATAIKCRVRFIRVEQYSALSARNSSTTKVIRVAKTKVSGSMSWGNHANCA